MQATDRITLVLRAKEGETLEQVLPFVQLGAPVSIGRGLAVIAGASDEDLQAVIEELQSAPQNIPKIIPANWNDKQVLDFCSVALRHVVVEGDLKFSDINDALRYMADKGEPAFLAAFSIDDHVRMVTDAKRYRHLRDKVCIEDADSDLLVLRGDTYLTGDELDRELDTALRLARLEELHSCAD